MEVGKLNVQVRNETGKGIARKLRAQGLVPGICYGEKLESPLAITLDPKALHNALDPEKKLNTVIDVTVDGGNTLSVMIKDYQIHPLRRDVIHVDFVAIDPNVEVDADVPILLTGKAKGLVEGGRLHVALRELRVSAKPADVPAKIELDITSLEIGDVLHVSDVNLPAGVETADAPELAIVTMTAPEKEEATSTVAAEGAEEGAAAPAEGKDDKKEGGDKA